MLKAIDEHQEQALQQDKVPQHVAITMDGNGRWAQKRGLPRYMGHSEGVKALISAVKFCVKKGISILTVFAFSTENWYRPKGEVNYLMGLMKRTFEKHIEELSSQGVRVVWIGDRNGLSKDITNIWLNAEELTKNNNRLILNIAFNYGGRNEITNATRRIVDEVLTGKINPEEITEELLSRYMYTGKYIDPDLIIRTGGEYRLSNFLLWQAAYAEWHITDTLWPDFSDEDFEIALLSFSRRQRRFGRVVE